MNPVVDYLVQGLVTDLIFFQAAMLVVIVSNLLLLRRARRHAPPPEFPLVSVLVPARDEEKNIRRCVESLLAQDYPACEVIALDDQSSDGTLSILQEIAGSQQKLKVLEGSSPPEGRQGKNWACAQLAQAARGDLLLFTDADTVHGPQALREMVTALLGEQADLVTGFPRQELQTWGERILVPFFVWASLSFNSLALAYLFRLPGLSVAIGQAMLFRRAAYEAVGGHERLGAVIVDDQRLARRITAAGFRWRMVELADLVSCRMYHGGWEAFRGFTKNYFATFDFLLVPFAFAFLWQIALFWVPLLVLAALALGYGNAAGTGRVMLCILLSLLVWLIPCGEMGAPPVLVLLYPLTVLANELAAIQSLRLSLAGRLAWKGRTLGRPRWRWLRTGLCSGDDDARSE